MYLRTLVSAFATLLVACGGEKTGQSEWSVKVRYYDTEGQLEQHDQKVDPKKTAVVVVDMWQLGVAGYINPDSTFTGTSEGYYYNETVADSINETISAARALGMVIIHAPSDQVGVYKDHPAREKVLSLPPVPYPWSEKPEWNEEQRKMPFAYFSFEYEYMYPHTPKERQRPGTESFGQNPRIVIVDRDYITDDPEEFWNIFVANGIETLIYLGGSTNMCLTGRPFGALNMLKYGKRVLIDRNYTHVIHRIPHGWNGDVDHPKYGPFYTNERNSKAVIDYIERFICPTLDGASLIESAQREGGFIPLAQPIREATVDKEYIRLSFQTQLIEVPEGYIIDIGWPYAEKANGLIYGWDALKIKDGIRVGFDPLTKSYVEAGAGDKWRMKLPLEGNYQVDLQLAGNGKVRVNDQSFVVSDSIPQRFRLNASNTVGMTCESGSLEVFEVSAVFIK